MSPNILPFHDLDLESTRRVDQALQSLLLDGPSRNTLAERLVMLNAQALTWLVAESEPDQAGKIKMQAVATDALRTWLGNGAGRRNNRGQLLTNGRPLSKMPS
jgi:hypothetical protein